MDLEMLNEMIKTSMCDHKDIEYDFEYDGEPYPMFLGATCLDCNKDFPLESFSEQEIMDISNEEAADMQGRAIDSAMGYQNDIRMGII